MGRDIRNILHYIYWEKEGRLVVLPNDEWIKRYQECKKYGMIPKSETVRREWLDCASECGLAYKVKTWEKYKELRTFTYKDRYIRYRTNRIPERMTIDNVSVLSSDKDNCFIAVIDTETTFSDEVMSVGVVIADGKTYQMLDKRYYLINPIYRQSAMYSHALHQHGIEEFVANRAEIIQNIMQLLEQFDVSSVFAYNASFDRNHLPELSYVNWYDIMKLAAYRQYNDKIPEDAHCCGTGRLKSGFGVENMLRLLSGDREYCETHHALTDAMDELQIMRSLNHPIQDYQIALI